MKLRVLVSLIFAVFGLAACGGGSGSVSTGGIYFDHEELAEEFVYRLNVDLIGYRVTLLKSYTAQEGYIVVRDDITRTNDAYYIDDYNPGENLNNYLNQYSFLTYYNLAPQGGNYFLSSDGILFDGSTEVVKDMALLTVNEQAMVINSMAKKIKNDFGFSNKQSIDTARFVYNFQARPGSYSAADIDGFVKSQVGFTLTEAQQDVANNDMAALRSKLANAQLRSGLDAEKTANFMQTLFPGFEI